MQIIAFTSVWMEWNAVNGICCYQLMMPLQMTFDRMEHGAEGIASASARANKTVCVCSIHLHLFASLFFKFNFSSQKYSLLLLTFANGSHEYNRRPKQIWCVKRLCRDSDDSFIKAMTTRMNEKHFYIRSFTSNNTMRLWSPHTKEWIYTQNIFAWWLRRSPTRRNLTAPNNSEPNCHWIVCNGISLCFEAIILFAMSRWSDGIWKCKRTSAQTPRPQSTLWTLHQCRSSVCWVDWSV